MTLEGSFAEYLSPMQNRKLDTSYIFTSTLFHKRKMIRLIDIQPIIKREQIIILTIIIMVAITV